MDDPQRAAEQLVRRRRGDQHEVDFPPALGGAFSLETGWGSGSTTPGFYGCFGRTSPTDLSGTEYFNFWINPNADLEETLSASF